MGVRLVKMTLIVEKWHKNSILCVKYLRESLKVFIFAADFDKIVHINN